MMSLASSVLKRVLTGTSTPPAVSNPNAAIIHSGDVRAQMATRSPLPTPRSAKAPAAHRIRSMSSANVKRSGPSTTASASPKRSAALKTIWGMVCQVCLFRASHRDESTEVAAHDLRLVVDGQVRQRVDVERRLRQPFRVRPVRAVQHPVHTDEVDQIVDAVLEKRADVNSALDHLDGVARESLRGLAVNLGQAVEQRRHPLRTGLDDRDL